MTTNVATVMELLGAGDDDVTTFLVSGGVPSSDRQLRALVRGPI